MGGHKSASHVCPVTDHSGPAIVPITGSLTFHDLETIISGACLAFSFLSISLLIIRHAIHFSVPKEQKQIIRIAFTIPVFALMSFLSIVSEPNAIYIMPLGILYESIALVSFFLLLIEFLHSSPVAEPSPPYQQQQHRQLNEQSNYRPSVNVQIPARTSLMIYQFFPVTLLITIVTEISQGTGHYCAESKKIYFAHIWCTVFSIISTALAIVALLGFYKAHKTELAYKKPLPKFIAFKGIVFLNFLQTSIFSFLKSSSVLKPTNHLTFNDLSIGIPNLLLSIEMVIFSTAFLHVYRVSPYRSTSPGGLQIRQFRNGFAKYGDEPEESETAYAQGYGYDYRGGPFGVKAYVAALNISDIVRGGLSAIGGLVSGRR